MQLGLSGQSSLNPFILQNLDRIVGELVHVLDMHCLAHDSALGCRMHSMNLWDGDLHDTVLGEGFICHQVERSIEWIQCWGIRDRVVNSARLG